MGCVISKQAESVSPPFHHSGSFKDNAGTGSGLSIGDSGGFVVEMMKKKKKRTESGLSGSELGESGRASSNGGTDAESLSFKLGNLQKYVEGEQVAAGWPGWLSDVAGEAIRGWVPRKADSFEKLEKIGQGTYSSVFRARDLDTGRIVALKKVQFDNFEPESVRFMAREILILRRLDHPNIIKLEGIITSRLSCSIYLVFEYMEHDISGLLSCPDIKFSEAQVKCYMKQLLSGLEHCHSRGVMHRDVKGANLLVNNEGVIKVGDFGLANFCNAGNRYPLTSRVVTLWYRPPELLLGSTDYGAYVDLWSVGCVFAELLLGNPVLQGRTEVEQLHKIFKLCGCPPEDYWRRTKLPHATLFKPQHPYESCLWDTFKELPNSAVNLIETFLSVEPCKRGTASSALASEYFTTKPYACDPSSLPKYPPSKEIDAKHHEEAKRKRPGGRTRGPESTRKLGRKQNSISKLAPEENLPVRTQTANKINGSGVDNQKEDIILGLESLKPSIDLKEDASHIKNASHGDIPYSGPLVVSGSSGFAWAKQQLDYSSMLSRSRSNSRSLMIEPSGALHLRCNLEAKRRENVEVLHGNLSNCTGYGSYELAKHGLLKKWCQLERPDSFDASDGYHSQEVPLELYQREEMGAKDSFRQAYEDHGEKFEFSGPLLSQSHKVDELLERHERQIRQAVGRTWFQFPKRKRPGGRTRGPESTRKLGRKQNSISKLAPEENLPVRTQTANKINGSGVDNQKEDIILGLESLKPSIDLKEDASHIKNASHGDIPYSGPLVVSGSSGFAWAKQQLDYSSMLSRSRSNSRSLMIEPSGALHLRCNLEAKRRENVEVLHGNLSNCTGYGSYELAKHGLLKKWCQLERPDSFDASDGYHSQEVPLELYQREEMGAKRFISAYEDHGEKFEFSGPLLSQSHKVDELLERHERQIRQAVGRTWFQFPKSLQVRNAEG